MCFSFFLEGNNETKRKAREGKDFSAYESERFLSFEAIESHRVNASNGSKGEGGREASRTVVFTRINLGTCSFHSFHARVSGFISIRVSFIQRGSHYSRFSSLLSLSIFIIPASPTVVHTALVNFVRIPFAPRTD